MKIHKVPLIAAGVLTLVVVGTATLLSNPSLLQGSVRASLNVTRAELATEVVTKALGTQTETCGDFVDVPVTASYNPYVCAAYTYGFMSGYDDGTFGPSELVTRAQAAKVVHTAFSINYDCQLPQLYADVALSDWYSEFVNELGIQSVFGSAVTLGGNFEPNSVLNKLALKLWLTNVAAL